jgi:hypothetical protein
VTAAGSAGRARTDAPATAIGALRAAPFLWGARTDLFAFGGSAAFALALVAAGHVLGISERPLPEWAWLAFVLLVDVAHVWSTLFRTYLDREEIARRRALYLGLPVALYAAGVAIHAASPMSFWRTLAYLAVFHFMRQQAGWVAIYRARAGERSRLDRFVDDLAIYASTGVPLFVWHAELPRAFSWFMPGDFVGSPSLRAFVPFAEGLLGVALAAFVVRQAQIAFFERRVNVGKIVVVATTSLVWWIGIVATDSDFDFTVTNVIIHGVPYVVLLWHYARHRAKAAPRALGSQIVRRGLAAFLGLIVALAFVEEMLWDRWVWHDRTWLFGGHAAATSASAQVWLLTLVVPLLALPQATHYALDAFLWRRRDAGPAQARATGFR